MKTHRPSIQAKQWIAFFLFIILSTISSWGQIVITGTVVDETQVPVPGANVVIKGENTTGTITDFDGNFTISVKDQSAVLVISFIGYTTQEVPVGSNTTLNIILKEDAVTLNEVVAIGYATVKKSD